MNTNPNANFAHVSRLLHAEKLLTAEYESARAAMSRDPQEFEACIAAMRRLRVFLGTREIPADIAEKLNQLDLRIPHHLCNGDLDALPLKRSPSLQKRRDYE